MSSMPMLSLKKRAIQGTVWTVAGYGISQALRFGANLILTRLLFPDLFGLMALVNTFIVGLHLFSDIGIRPSIIQNPRGDDPVFLNTAWTLQVIRGIGLWGCCLLIAWPLSVLYQNPMLLWLIPLVGLTTILDGFASTAIATLSRHLAVAKLTLFDLSIQLCSVVVMIAWAYMSRSIWPLVGNSLVAAALRTIWSHRLSKTTVNRFAWDPLALKELIHFGQWIFLSTVMTFLSGQADRLILGRLFPLELLGIYIVAFTLSDLPQQVIQAVGSNVLFPLMSQQMHLPRPELRHKILEKRNFLLLGSMVILIGLIGFGDRLIQLLYDHRYHQAAWMLPILALGNWPRMLPMTIAPALLAAGKPLYGAIGNCLKFVYMLVALPVAFTLFGPLGAVIVVAFNDLPFYLAISYGQWQEGFSSLKQDMVSTGLLLIGATGVIALRYGLGFGLPIDSLWLASP